MRRAVATKEALTLDPELHAEQALLGALLLEPARIEEVQTFLSPDHLYRPAHTALYRALLEAGSNPTKAETPMPARVMALVRASGRHAAGITPIYAHTLMAACPHPRNAALYARMIVEAADHRAIGHHAIRLGQVATTDLARDGITDTLAHHQALHTALRDLARRWGQPRDTPTPDPRAIRSASPEHPDPRDIVEERALVATLVADPAPLGEIARWFDPTDFADPAHAAVYRCVSALTHRGEAVDPVTVLWESQRRGYLADNTIDPEHVLALGTTGVPGRADYWARRILRTSLLRAAATGARSVRALADDRALSSRSLVAAARNALAPLDAIRGRWHSATRTPPPQQPLASVTRAAARPKDIATHPPPSSPDPTRPTAAHRTPERRHR